MDRENEREKEKKGKTEISILTFSLILSLLFRLRSFVGDYKFDHRLTNAMCR